MLVFTFQTWGIMHYALCILQIGISITDICTRKGSDIKAAKLLNVHFPKAKYIQNVLAHLLYFKRTSKSSLTVHYIRKRN